MIDYPNCGENNPVFEQDEPVAHLWQHVETGRTRIVMPDQIITADASWFVVGPLFLYTTSQPRKPLTGEVVVIAAQSCLSPQQYDHFEALLENDQDAHNRLARAIEAVHNIKE